MATKSLPITKMMVWNAFKRIKANGGSAGVDGQSIEEFERDLKNNLYKLWNRMASGSYFPPAVKRVEIPKAAGGVRPLGIPTVADRIAQMVVKMVLEITVEPYFHPDSYGYRPHKSAHQAIGMARQRCWEYRFVLDVDIKGFFDNIDHELLMKAVRKHSKENWVAHYIERWLKAPVQLVDGTLESRDRGTPQGGVISPLLANLYLHYAFDLWMKRNYPRCPFERYADDIVIHLRSEKQAIMIREKLEERLRECKLELHPVKTKTVCCKKGKRRKDHLNIKFTFLGYEFKPRVAKRRDGKRFCSFLPGTSPSARKEMSRTIRAWKLKWRNEKSIEDLSRMFNPIVRGWVQYYSKYYKTSMKPIAIQINEHLVKWLANKYKNYRRSKLKAIYALGRLARQKTHLFAHWSVLGLLPTDGMKRAV